MEGKGKIKGLGSVREGKNIRAGECKGRVRKRAGECKGREKEKSWGV